MAGDVRKRWCPSKEQLSFLQSLFDGGLQSPSESEIAEITRRLREFGDVGERNVFYWFQNHKARDRNKHHQYSSSLHCPSDASSSSFPHNPDLGYEGNSNYRDLEPCPDSPQPRNLYHGAPADVPTSALYQYHQFTDVSKVMDLSRSDDVRNPTTSGHNEGENSKVPRTLNLFPLDPDLHIFKQTTNPHPESEQKNENDLQHVDLTL